MATSLPVQPGARFGCLSCHRSNSASFGVEGAGVGVQGRQRRTKDATHLAACQIDIAKFELGNVVFELGNLAMSIGAMNAFRCLLFELFDFAAPKDAERQQLGGGPFSVGNVAMSPFWQSLFEGRQRRGRRWPASPSKDANVGPRTPSGWLARFKIEIKVYANQVSRFNAMK